MFFGNNENRIPSIARLAFLATFVISDDAFFTITVVDKKQILYSKSTVLVVVTSKIEGKIHSIEKETKTNATHQWRWPYYTISSFEVHSGGDTRPNKSTPGGESCRPKLSTVSFFAMSKNSPRALPFSVTCVYTYKLIDG